MSILNWIRVRFSLRLLLIITGVVCVALGCYASVKSRILKEHRAISALQERYDALVSISAIPGEEPNPYWDLTMYHKGDLYRSADRVFFADTNIDRECFSILSSLSQLDTLEFQDLSISSSAIRGISMLPQLESLVFNSCSLPDKFATDINRLSNLRKLHIIDSGVSGEQLEIILDGTFTLENCYLSGDSLNNECLSNLKSHHNLRNLGLETSNNISSTIESLSNSNVEVLSLGYMPLGTGMATALSDFPKLNVLRLFRVNIEAEAEEILRNLNRRCSISYVDVINSTIERPASR
jgi:hypothetical protein